MHAPGREKGAQEQWPPPLDHEGAPCGRRAPLALKRQAGLKDPRHPAPAAARLHRGEPDGWRAPRKPGRSGGRRTSTWTAILPRSRCCARTGPEDTPRPRGPAALKLAQMAAGALREWQVDQAAEHRLPERIGSTPAGYLPRPPVHHWVRGTSGRCSRTFAREPGPAGTGRLGACGTSSSRCCPTTGWRSRRSLNCWPCQQPCHRDRVPTGAPAGPAGRRRGNGPALWHRQQRPG